MRQTVNLENRVRDPLTPKYLRMLMDRRVGYEPTGRSSNLFADTVAELTELAYVHGLDPWF